MPKAKTKARTKKQRAKQLLKAFGIVSPRFRYARIPGQVIPMDTTQQELKEVMKLVNTKPRKETMELLLEDNRPVSTLQAITKDLGLSKAEETDWQNFFREVLHGSPNQLVMRQAIHARFQIDATDPQLRKALFQRALKYYKKRNQLSKAEARGGKYHRRIRTEKGGYRYVYDQDKYDSRDDAHISGEEASRNKAKRDLIKRLEQMGTQGCSPADLTAFAKTLGAKGLTRYLKESCKGGSMKYEKGRFYIGKQDDANDNDNTEKSAQPSLTLSKSHWSHAPQKRTVEPMRAQPINLVISLESANIEPEIYLEKAGALTPQKARKILRDGEVNGQPLTEQQRKYFGAIAGGETPLAKAKYTKRTGTPGNYKYEYADDQPKGKGKAAPQLTLDFSAKPKPKEAKPAEDPKLAALKDLPIGPKPVRKEAAFKGDAFSADDVTSGNAPYKVGDALHPDHKDENSAWVIDDYPYGRGRTQMRVWIESNKKGEQRIVRQTLNPKTDRWNAPKKSTYSDALVAVFDDKGHIHTEGMSLAYRSGDQIPKFLEKWGGHISEKLRTNAELMHHYDTLTGQGVDRSEALALAKKKWLQNSKQRGVIDEVKKEVAQDKAAKEAKKQQRKQPPTGEPPSAAGMEMAKDRPLPDIDELAGLSHQEFTQKFTTGDGREWAMRNRASKMYKQLAKQASDANRPKLATQYKYLSVAARRVGGYQNQVETGTGGYNGAAQMDRFLEHAKKHGTDKNKLDKSEGRYGDR